MLYSTTARSPPYNLYSSSPPLHIHLFGYSTTSTNLLKKQHTLSTHMLLNLGSKVALFLIDCYIWSHPRGSTVNHVTINTGLGTSITFCCKYKYCLSMFLINYGLCWLRAFHFWLGSLLSSTAADLVYYSVSVPLGLYILCWTYRFWLEKGGH